MNTQLIDFYMGRGTDTNGRTLEEILSWPDNKLESVHDYIQWVFPLQERSVYNPDAPLLDDEDMNLFKESEVLQRQVRRSFQRILRFYGFVLSNSDGEIIIRKAAIFGTQSRYWLNKFDHNHLRITRIMICLCLVGMNDYAESLLRVLEEVYQDYEDVIREKTMSFWRDAVN